MWGPNWIAHHPSDVSFFQINLHCHSLSFLISSSLKLNILIRALIDFAIPSTIIDPVGKTPTPSICTIGGINNSKPEIPSFCFPNFDAECPLFSYPNRAQQLSLCPILPNIGGNFSLDFELVNVCSCDINMIVLFLSYYLFLLLWSRVSFQFLPFLLGLWGRYDDSGLFLWSAY